LCESIGAMRTTNRKRYEALAYLLARCEEDRRALERMPEGKALLDQMRAAVQTARPHFPVSQRRMPKRTRWDSQGVGLRASLIRMQMKDLLHDARVVAAARGVAVELPTMCRRSHRHLIEDAESALKAIAPFAAALRARGITAHEHLPRQIAFFKALKEQGPASRRRETMTRVLTAGWKAAVQLQPLYLAMFRSDPYRKYIWKKVRWTAPARARKRNTGERSGFISTRPADAARRTS